ncbi:GumC family protein [Novosphingobium jiangmenense]|uniref:non-specific protein-tyrosine kinase n=1 Tax=Novosphingobium jiangmenense TaxID=2791981 RepID=A0ABS0HBM4_9SPHN|nr:Wzz/FepE/Etk N-terminal domain-containing protein [Novosphingobium jiangmenense]MBF9149669.1 AAA family ATPase [Novosphingobium jiangmenense]
MNTLQVNDGPAKENGNELDLKRLLEIARRRWAIIVGTAAIVGVLATIVVMQITPLYESAASVAIETRKTQVVDVEQVVSSVQPDMATLATEAETIRSPDILTRIVDLQRLYDDPEFLGQQAKGGFKWWSPSTWFGSSRSKDDEKAGDANGPDDLAHRKEIAIANLGARLRVDQVKNSYVLLIKITSRDSDKAARLANALASEYIAQQIGTKFEATRRATNWLEKRVEELRLQSVAADKAVETYRVANGIVGGAENVTIGDQQLTDVNSQLMMARAARAEKQTQLNQINQLLANGGAGLESSSAILQSGFISGLRQQEIDIQRKLSEMRTNLGERHPRVVNANAELRDLREKIKIEIRKIAAATANDLSLAQAREKSLSASLAAATGRTGSEKMAAVKLRELETNAQSAKSLYENFLNRYKETSEQQGIQSPDARIITLARPAFYPSYPQKVPTLIAALVAGLVLGGALAFALEYLDPFVRLAEEVEEITGRPTLTMVSLTNPGGDSPEDAVLSNPHSATSESLTTLRAAIETQLSDWPRQIIMITSSIAGEGKTFTSVTYARSLAMRGQRVLLMELDLRRPRVGSALGLESGPGFAEVILGEQSVGNVLVRDSLSDMDVLLAGARQRSPNELLLRPEFPALLDELRKLYDTIIIDTAPFAPISDSQVISKHVDMVLLSVAWAKAPVSVVKNVVGIMKRLEVPLAGTIMSLVDLRKYASYDNLGYNYYYYRYKAYTYGS